MAISRSILNNLDQIILSVFVLLTMCENEAMMFIHLLNVFKTH